jgi:hypothetical protein
MSEKEAIEKNTRRELREEVLRRAKPKEKQEYAAIIERQIAIAQRMKDMQLETKVLEERDRNNEYPKEMASTYQAPDKSHKEIMEMSNGEFHEWCQQIHRDASEFNAEAERWNERFAVWNARNTVISNERWKLMGEAADLRNEFDSLKEEEKWLLLSIALRSQPNLLKYM